MKIDVLNAGYVQLIEHYGSDNSILEAARMSTQNPTGVDQQADDNLRRYLWRNQHSTPFEFAGAVLEVQLPLFVARQWQRHRTFSYNEFSARYSAMPELAYVPTEERVVSLLLQGDVHNKQTKGVSQGNPEDAAALVAAMTQANQNAYEQYLFLLEKGMSREIARCVLPVSWYTRMRVSGNLLNWLKFAKLRADSHAQHEIQVYATAVEQILEQLFPKSLELYRRYTKGSTTLSGPAWDLIRNHLGQNKDFLGELKTLGLPTGEYRDLLGALNPMKDR